ncbi:MAG: type III-B CRISPR module RAMP protein Cmr6 [Verrucomicrobiota bacterium]
MTRGSDLLRADSQRLRREARGHNVQPRVVARKERDAHVAEKMASVARVDGTLARSANQNAKDFLADLMKSFAGGVATFEATLGARMMINLAGGVVENAGIALDRCFGLPFIPGSAVKGITRAQALAEIRDTQGIEKARLLRMALLLFGFGARDLKGDFGAAGGIQEALAISDEWEVEEFKGCACFLPAYPTSSPTLVVDMVNPHYPEYYSGRRMRAEDNESPIPNYFPAVEAGSSFGFALVINRVPPDWGVNAENLLDQLKQWVERAVTSRGAGAKTASGYGWFELGRGTIETATRPAHLATVRAVPSSSQAEVTIKKWRGRLSTKDNFPAALPELAELKDDADLQRAFETLIPEQERRRNRRNNPYWQSFTSGRHADAGKRILSRLKFNLT